MANLNLTMKEIGWIKYCLIKTASINSQYTRPSLTNKEHKLLWDLLDKIEKQEKNQKIKK